MAASSCQGYLLAIAGRLARIDAWGIAMLKLRRRSIFTNLGRTRLGLTEGDVQLAVKPKRSLLVLAAATGLAPVHKAKGAGDVATSRRMTQRRSDLP